MNRLTKDFNNIRLLIVALTVTIISLSCNSNKGQPREENAEAKEMLQGVWINSIEGNIVFRIDGDTIFYSDSLSSPARFHVYDDTLLIDQHTPVRYPIVKLTAETLSFISDSGDSILLTKETDDYIATEQAGRSEKVVTNQGRTIKADTVMTYDGRHYHAYKQVNPTSYKVYQQSQNSEGMNTESVYYDNIVYVSLYEGYKKLFGQNFEKADFSEFVPASFLEQAVLSDIVFDKMGKDGMKFVAILSIPDSSTSYKIKITVSATGKKSLSL